MVDEVEGEVEGDGGKDAGDEGPVEGAAVEDQLEADQQDQRGVDAETKARPSHHLVAK